MIHVGSMGKQVDDTDCRMIFSWAIAITLFCFFTLIDLNAADKTLEKLISNAIQFNSTADYSLQTDSKVESRPL